MLILDEKVKHDMIRDALSTYPNECCGFLFGTENRNRKVTFVKPVNNSKSGDKRRRYEISALDYMRAEQFAEDHDLTLLGVYHSHPDHPAVPSETDQLSAQPYFSYIILSILKTKFAKMRSWKLNDENQFEEEQILELIVNEN